MSRIVALGLGVVLSFGLAAAAHAQGAAPATQPELRLGDCTIFVESTRVTFIARKGQELYAGTLAGVVRCERGNQSGRGSNGRLMLNFTETPGAVVQLQVKCGTTAVIFTQMGDASWAQLPKGKDTTVPICPEAGGDKCPLTLIFPCGETMASLTSPPPAGVRSAAAAATGAAEYQVQLIEGEVVPADQIHVMLRSELIEEGEGVALMSRLQKNIDEARTNFNTYRAGYAIPVEKNGDRFQFVGPTRGYRATGAGAMSMWPPFIYPASRREAMRRARAPEPVLPQVECPEMKNLRVYFYPISMGHDGKDYVTEPTVFAFFVDPKTGNRMTVFYRGNRSYGAVSPSPLNITSKMYIQEVSSFQAGPFGVATAYSPSIFYSREVRVEHQPFAQGDTFDRVLAEMQAARGKLVANEFFGALAREMSRYTGGGFAAR
jgi:hypothetical protein